MLSCTEYRKYWITWDTSALGIGSGWSPGSNIFLQQGTLNLVYPRRVTVSKAGNAETADWLFPPCKDNVKSVYRKIMKILISPGSILHIVMFMAL